MDTYFLEDESHDLNGKYDTILLNLHNLVNKHFPKKELNKWALKLNKQTLDIFRIQKLMKIRDSLFQKFKSTKSSDDFRHINSFEIALSMK